MRRAATLIALAGCTGGAPAPEPGPDPEATRIAAQKLCIVFQYVDVKCRASEDLVEAGDRTLRVAATVRHKVDVAGTAARSVRYEVSLNGEPPGFGVDVLGKGLSPADALDRAAQEWAALAGTAIVDAVRHTGRADAAHAALARVGRAAKGEGPLGLSSGPFTVYPGLSDFRGAAQGGPNVDHEGLVGVLASEILALDPSTPHSLLVAVTHDGVRFACESGQIDGRDVDRVCQVAASFTWPAPVRQYSARQFYAIVPRAQPAPAAAPDQGEPPPP
jgi:hypothetical protein